MLKTFLNVEKDVSHLKNVYDSKDNSELISFLKAADNSGSADPRKFRSNSFGMIEKE